MTCSYSHCAHPLCSGVVVGDHLQVHRREESLPQSSRFLLDRGRLTASKIQVGITACAYGDGKRSRYWVGLIPNVRRNAVVNEPTLESPTDIHISATL